MPIGGPIEEIVDAPQVPITRKEGQRELAHMRTEIVKTILDWGHGREYVADQLRKKRRTGH